MKIDTCLRDGQQGLAAWDTKAILVFPNGAEMNTGRTGKLFLRHFHYRLAPQAEAVGDVCMVFLGQRNHLKVYQI